MLIWNNVIATAVARIDNLEFLADVIPKTITYKQYKENRANEAAAAASATAGADSDAISSGPPRERGQSTLNGALQIQRTTANDGKSSMAEADKKKKQSNKAKGPASLSLLMADEASAAGSPSANPTEVEGKVDVDVNMTEEEGDV